VHHDAAPRDPPPGAPSGRDIASLTADDLRAFRVGGEPIPPLTDAIALCHDRVRLYCELKGAATADPAARLLEPLGSGAAVHSFDHRQIAECRRFAPTLARGVLESSYHLDPTESLRSVDGRDLWMAWELIDADLVSAVHGAHGRVVAWTVNTAAAMSRLANLGVDAVCTDEVTLARETFGR
jgi:glycerophosphoryl diester phosphodiesterase